MKCPIIFGRINKKLILPVLLSITQIIFLIFNKYYPKTTYNIIFQLYCLSLGQLMIRFLPCILKIKNDEKKGKEIKKRKCLHYFFLCLIFGFNQNLHFARIITNNIFLDEKTSYISNLFLVNDFIILSIEISFMAIFSKFLLKYKYFKHHIISIILFIILGIICEVIIVKNDGNKNISNKWYWIVNIIRVVNSLVDALYFCYQKYMMEVLYYPYWNIAFIPAIFMLAYATILLIIILVIPIASIIKIQIFYSYFTNTNGWIIFGKVIIVVFIHVILCPLTILIIFYFSPNFLLIIFQLSTIVFSLIEKPRESVNCIPLYIIQFLVLMIHLEILELNFCGLNKYTKRNIELRGLNDSSPEENNSITRLEKIDINKDYFIENIKKNERTTEMVERAEIMEEIPNNDIKN